MAKRADTAAKKKTVKSRIETASANVEADKNEQPFDWRILVCPSCGHKKFDSIDLDEKKWKWTLQCQKCQKQWVENLRKPQKTTKKITKAQKAAFQKQYEIAREKVKSTRAKTKPQVQETPPPKKPRKPHATRGQEKELELIEERREIVWGLHKGKLSIREISKHIEQILDKETGKQKFSAFSAATICDDLTKIRNIRRIAKNVDIEDDIDEEIAILDEIHRVYYPVLKRKEDNRLFNLDARNDAAHFILMASDRRCKLKNLYKPVKIVIEDDRDFAAQLGLNPEELPHDGDEA